MPSQPTKIGEANTVVSWVESLLRSQPSKEKFVSPAHRLDTPTSGLLCVCIEKKSAAALQTQFTQHQAKRIYLALVHGEIVWEESSLVHRIEVDKSRSLARVVSGNAGKEAKSFARVLQRKPQKSCVILAPETGLTHQLRVQLQAIGHPILGDSRYGKGGAGRIALHAFGLSLRHPTTKQEMFFEAPPGEDFWALW